MFRWQGGVDARLDEHGRRLNEINGDAKAARVTGEEIMVKLAVLNTKVAFWSTLGSLVGAGLMTAVIRLLG